MLALKLTYSEQINTISNQEKETIRTFGKITHGKQMDFNCQLNASLEGLSKNNNTVYMVVVEANTEDSLGNEKNAHCEPVFAFLDKEKARKLAKTIRELNNLVITIDKNGKLNGKTPLEVINEYRITNNFLPYKQKSEFDLEYLNEFFFIDDKLQSNVSKMFWNSLGYSLFDVKIIKRQVEEYGDEEFY